MRLPKTFEFRGISNICTKSNAFLSSNTVISSEIASSLCSLWYLESDFCNILGYVDVEHVADMVF